MTAAGRESLLVTCNAASWRVRAEVDVDSLDSDVVRLRDVKCGAEDLGRLRLHARDISGFIEASKRP
jgi:hypothetical protein